MEPSQPYHVAHEGDRVGPWPVEDIRRRLSAGELSPNDLAWREGMTDWEPLHKLLMPEDAAVLPTSVSGQRPGGDGQPVIQTRNLTKSFGGQVALNEVSVTVRPGAIGLLGPNGAGKTTFIKCLLQLHDHTHGDSQLLGEAVGQHGREIRRRVGYAPEQDCFIPGMVGCEYVTYCARLSGLPFRDARQRAHEMLDFVGMGQERYREVETYSTGMKQRLKLAQAIVHDPEIVFLDEPTNGLDPKGREQVLDLVHSLWKRHGITVMLSSHLLHDVDRICDQIIIIAGGRVMVHDTLENLKARKAGVLELVPATGVTPLMAALAPMNLPAEELPNGHVHVTLSQQDIRPLLKHLHDHGQAPLEIMPSAYVLEEIYVQSIQAIHGAN